MRHQTDLTIYRYTIFDKVCISSGDGGVGDD